MVFDYAFGNVEPKFSPVAPFIAGAGNQLNDFHRSLARLRRKCARSKLSNLISDFPFLPMQTIILREVFDRGLPAVRSRCPDIFRQSHHGIWRQLVDLDVESTQNFSHKSMRGQTKASGEKSLEDDQLAFWLGDLLRPRDTCHSAAKITKLLHVLHADRGHPRHAKLHYVAGAQLRRRHIAQHLLGRRASRRCIGSRRGRGRHRYVPSAAAGGLLHTGQISDEQEQGGQTSSKRFEKEVRVFVERGKIKFKTRRPPPPFIHRAWRFGKPAIQQYGVNQRSCQKPPWNHFERGQRLHHLATSSAPDDLVKLVPRRANIGAKAKTPPFARCLRRPRCTNEDKTTGRLTLRPTRRRAKACDEVVSSCGLIQHGGPRAIRPIVTGPAWPLSITGLICKGLPVIIVYNPALWEYSGDNLGA
jgi:hypothetical protein